MQNWFCGKNIPCSDTILKVRLYEIKKAYKPKNKSFTVDEIIPPNGHMVQRLLLYHPDLCPTELIWADMKQWVGANNTTFCIDDVKHHCEQRFKEAGADEWSNVCEHVEKLEKQYYGQEA
jgi:hypothetical protein